MTDEGELIAGRYRLVSRVGRGAMGVVWQAKDERLDRTVAVKQLLLDAAADETTSAQACLRTMREGRVAARLRHPHAITVHDVVEHAGKPCLIMEFLPSRSLSDVLVENGTQPPGYVATLGSQLASALAAAHAEGIVHRDVTPGNVLIAPDGTVKIADFGISRAVGEGTVTGIGIIAGTPAYLAPEVAGGKEAGFPSDVFSLGATLYTALEGKPPFGVDENPIALLQRVAREEIIPPTRSGPLADVLVRILRRDPAERPTMAETHEALTAVANGEQPRLPPVPVVTPRQPTMLMPPRRSRRRYVVAGVVAAFLVALGILIGSLLNRDQGTAASPSSPAPAPAPPRPGCSADYRVVNTWPGGYQVTVTVRGNADTKPGGWTVSWALPSGEKIGGLWNGTLRQQGSTVTVLNAEWNKDLTSGGPVTFGFLGSFGKGAPATPALSCQTP